ESGNSEIAEEWSRWRWVITTVGTWRGSIPLARSCEGTSSPAFSGGRPKRLARPPKFSEAPLAIGGWRPVSTRIGPALGWWIRKAGTGTVSACLELEIARARRSVLKLPPGATIAARGKARGPAI